MNPKTSGVNRMRPPGNQNDGLAHVVRIEREENPRLVRLRRLAWLLDQSVSVGGFRFGLDPLIGLVPGVGDTLAAGLSTIILYHGARLGLPVYVLLRMVGNVMLELLVGAVPIVGDIFDFVWRANARNFALVERHYDPSRAARPAQRIAWAIVILMIAGLAGALGLMVGVLRALWQVIDEVG